jgi:hypothetical protein
MTILLVGGKVLAVCLCYSLELTPEIDPPPFADPHRLLIWGTAPAIHQSKH